MDIKSDPPKMASGFHGGGGAVEINEEGTKGTPTGCMCGALAAGILILGVLYGRTAPIGPRYGCISRLSAHLHKRFQEEVGGKCCAMIRPFYQKIDQEKSCREIYKKGAELAVEVALSAPETVVSFRQLKSLYQIVNKSQYKLVS